MVGSEHNETRPLKIHELNPILCEGYEPWLPQMASEIGQSAVLAKYLKPYHLNWKNIDGASNERGAICEV